MHSIPECLFFYNALAGLAFSNYLRELTKLKKMALNLFNRNSEQGEMSFVDHLEALRWHIVRSAFAIVIVAIVIYIKINWIFDNIIRGPIRNDFVSYVGLCNLGRK